MADMSMERFKQGHACSYSQALAEIRAGRKTSHWIWYIFPQLRGLGFSANSDYYGMDGIREARAYWEDALLRDHMVEILEALLEQEAPIREIMGPDSKKLRSSMTLFWLATEADIFRRVLDRFFGGRLDSRTKEMLEGTP
jgi:uncharacterized protein (DUF1810 family)